VAEINPESIISQLICTESTSYIRCDIYRATVYYLSNSSSRYLHVLVLFLEPVVLEGVAVD
jgi:hypothetical protein